MHSTRVLGVLLLVLIAASPAVAVDWGSLTQETLAALPVSDFQSATSGDISVIPPTACAGFDAAQLAALSSTAIDGMTTYCIDHLPNDAWAQLSASSAAGLSGSQCAALTGGAIQSVPAAAFAGFGSACAHNLVGGSYGACASITPEQLASLQPSAAAQLTQSCVDGTGDSAWSLVTPAIAHALTATQCQAFVSAQLSQFNVTAFAALQPACTGVFTGGLYGACAGLTSNQMAVLSATAASGLTQSCVVATGAIWGGLTPTAAAAFTSSACEGFTQQSLHSANPAAFAGWSDTCVGQFTGGNSGACADLTEAQVGYFTAANAVGISQTCVVATASVWGKLTTAAAAALSSDACGGFMSTNMGSLNPEAFGYLTAKCTAALTGGQSGACAGLQTAQIGYMSPTAASGLQSSCVVSTGAVWGSLQASAAASLTSNACSGFQASNMASVSPASFGSFSKTCTAKFQGGNSGACAGFTVTQLGKLSATAASGLQSSCVVSTNNVWGQITAPAAAALTGNACGGFQASSMASFMATAFVGLTKACVANLDGGLSGACAGITSQQMFYMTPAAAAGLQQSCTVAMQDNALSLAQPDVIAAFTSSACGGIQAPLLRGANPNALSGLQPTCATQLYSACSGFTRLSLREVPPTTFYAFGASCLVNMNQPSMWNNVTANRIAQLSHDGCQGMPGAAFAGLPAASYAGFTASCLSQMSQACAAVTAPGMQALLPGNYSGFQISCMVNVPAASLALVSAAQVSYLGKPITADFDNNVCGGLSAAQAAAMPATAFSGVRNYCATFLGAACGGLSVDDWKQLPVEQAIAYIPGACVGALTDAVVSAMSLSPDVTSLSFSGFGGFQGHQLGLLFEQHGTAFPAAASVDQAAALPHVAIKYYAGLFRAGGFQPSLTLADVPHNPQSVNALELVSLTDAAVQGATEEWVCSVRPESFTGWRGGQVVEFPSAWFANFTVRQVLSLNVLPNITAAQLGQLQPNALLALINKRPAAYDVGFPVQRLTISAVQGITKLQMASINPYLFTHFSVDQLQAFTATQRSYMTTAQKQEVSALVHHTTPPASDDDHPVTDDDQHTDDDHVHHHDDDHHGSTASPGGGGISGGVIAAIVFAAVFVMGAAGAVFWVKVVRPRGGWAGFTSGGGAPSGYAEMDAAV